MVNKLAIWKSRQVDTYIEMYTVACEFFSQASPKPEGWFYPCLASLTFFAFTFEAYLNHLGSILFRRWDDLEQLSPMRKLNVIAERLGVTVVFGESPFQIIKQLFSFRNNIAHGKSELVEDGITVPMDDSNNSLHSIPRTDWEEFCTLQTATFVKRDVEMSISLLHKKAGLGDNPFTNSDWFGTATITEV